MILSHRMFLGDIANALDLQTAVEVGTHQAVFASEFMRRFRGSITLIDPYTGYDNPTNKFYPMFDESTVDRESDFVIANCEMHACAAGRHSFVRLPSEEAVRNFEDEEVGIVYLDGLHDMENITKDIALWYPKVKRGGIISGHDYCWLSHPAVCTAVDRFFAHRSRVFLTEDEMPSWWVIKP